jgi:hypothetical protein
MEVVLTDPSAWVMSIFVLHFDELNQAVNAEVGERKDADPIFSVTRHDNDTPYYRRTVNLHSRKLEVLSGSFFPAG